MQHISEKVNQATVFERITLNLSVVKLVQNWSLTAFRNGRSAL